MATLRSLLTDICKQWPEVVKENYDGHAFPVKFKAEFVAKVSDILVRKHPNLQVKGSIGLSRWATIAWIAALDPDVTETVRDGFYPIYRFKADGSGVYLCLMYGLAIPTEKHGTVKARALAAQTTADIFKTVPALQSWGESTIDLGGSTTRGKAYDKANITAKYYAL
ncbi:MAG: DUF3578 domain-containing protein, partial [Psychrosphaera sp.]|nr:DUF3578 domain-containing protein [Psychrosphaera sp.]